MVEKIKYEIFIFYFQKEYKYRTYTTPMSKGLKPYVALILAGCLFGTISTFSAMLRDMDVSSFQQSFLRIFFALIYISIIFYYKKINFLINFEELKYYIFLGLIMSVLGFFETTAVVVGTPVAVVILLIYTQPMWTTIFGKIFLKESVDAIKKLAVFISTAGVFLVSQIWNISSLNYLGFSISLICGILLSVDFIMIKELSLKPKYFLVSIFWFYVFEILFIAILGYLTRIITDDKIITSFNFSLSVEIWVIILLSALLPMFFGMILFYTSVKYVPIASAGVILLMEPISGIVYGYFILGENVGSFTIIGGILILFASLLVIKR